MKTSISYKVCQVCYDDSKLGLLPQVICDMYGVDIYNKYDETYGLSWMAGSGLRMLQHDLLEHWHEGYGITKATKAGEYFGEAIALGQLLYLRDYTNIRKDVIHADIAHLAMDLIERQEHSNTMPEEEVLPYAKPSYLDYYRSYTCDDLSYLSALAVDKVKKLFDFVPKGFTEDRIARWLGYGWNLARKRYADDGVKIEELFEDIKVLNNLLDSEFNQLLLGATITLHTNSNLAKEKLTYRWDIKPIDGEDMVGLRTLKGIDIEKFMEPWQE